VNSLNRDKLSLRANVFKALSHPTRLFIVDELAKESRCVGDLTKLIGADVSTVSKHLSVLKSAGIVRDEKRGMQVYYALQMPCVLSFSTCIEQVARESAEWHLELTREHVEH